MTPTRNAQSDAWADAIVRQCRELCDYARRMVEPLDDAQMVAQPIPGVTLNHPAWILSHLRVYAELLAAILRAQQVEDPIDHPFGRNSTPMRDPGVYLPRPDLLSAYERAHTDACDALLAVPAGVLDAPCPVERWRPRFPTVAHLPTQFLLKHHATHLGQLSAWRRAMGLPRV